MARPEAAATFKADALALIATKHLGLQTLATRHSDGLDFTDQSVWQLKAALEAAFEAGRASAQVFGK